MTRWTSSSASTWVITSPNAHSKVQVTRLGLCSRDRCSINSFSSFHVGRSMQSTNLMYENLEWDSRWVDVDYSIFQKMYLFNKEFYLDGVVIYLKDSQVYLWLFTVHNQFLIVCSEEMYRHPMVGQHKQNVLDLEWVSHLYWNSHSFVHLAIPNMFIFSAQPCGLCLGPSINWLCDLVHVNSSLLLWVPQMSESY